jgi:hypothetical protein
MDSRSKSSKLQITVLIRPDTYEYIRNHALSNRVYGAYIDNLVQKERIKGITLDKLHENLDHLIQSIQRG